MFIYCLSTMIHRTLSCLCLQSSSALWVFSSRQPFVFQTDGGGRFEKFWNFQWDWPVRTGLEHVAGTAEGWAVWKKRKVQERRLRCYGHVLGKIVDIVRDGGESMLRKKLSGKERLVWWKLKPLSAYWAMKWYFKHALWNENTFPQCVQITCASTVLKQRSPNFFVSRTSRLLVGSTADQ